MELKFITLDVFTTTPLKGNPLAIVSLPPDISITQTQKQLIAREFNLSETVFLHEASNSSSQERRIDIFTIDAELPFAGHPTIGSAVAVQSLDVTHLITKAGIIPITYLPDGFARAAIPHNVHLHTRGLKDLQPEPKGLSPSALLKESELQAPVFSIVKGMSFVLVELPALEALAEVELCSTDFRPKELLDDGWQDSFLEKYYFVKRGMVEDEHGMKTYKLRTRMIGLDMEDPATGSAACALSSYLALVSGKGGETLRFDITQGVEMGRESNIFVTVILGTGNDGPRLDKLYLAGTARQVMAGTITIP